MAFGIGMKKQRIERSFVEYANKHFIQVDFGTRTTVK